MRHLAWLGYPSEMNETEKKLQQFLSTVFFALV
jgi:hypothetical protein